MKYSSHDHFMNDIAEFRQKLELHRLKCRRIFVFSALLGTLIIVSLPWSSVPIAELLNSMAAGVGGEGWKPDASIQDAISVAFFLFFVGIALILWPIFSYRGKESAGSHVARDYALQDHVYSNLLSKFGEFSFATNGGVLLADLHRATIIPMHHHYTAEDCAVGVINDCVVKIAQTNLTRTVNGSRESVFRGLVIAADVSDSKVKLRRPFSGRTVLIADSKKHLETTKKTYQNFEMINLKDITAEAEFEAYSNSPAEAKALLDSDILSHINRLKKCLSNLTQQQQHIDDRISHAFWALIDGVRLMPRKRLVAEKQYEQQFAYGLDLSKSDPLSRAADSIHDVPYLEFYEDKFVVLLPCKHDLFETNSLFEPALNDEDTQVLFELMSTLDKVTHRLQRHLSS